MAFFPVAIDERPIDFKLPTLTSDKVPRSNLFSNQLHLSRLKIIFQIALPSNTLWITFICPYLKLQHNYFLPRLTFVLRNQER
jgi:hypothetical protein